MDIVRRLVWFALVATVAFFSIFVVLGNFALLSAEGTGPLPIHDALSPGMHRINGILMVPLACDELSVTVQKATTTAYVLQFETWEDPSVDCPETPTPRAFQAIVFAPSLGVDFAATMDGKPFPIVVIPDIATTTKDL